jgi:glycosyltransferase involved in cell wall biosynthesis
MIRILYLIDRLGYGGTEKQLACLIRGLNRERFQPHLCTIRPSTGLLDELKIPKVQIDLRSFREWRFAASLRQLARFIREYDIHIVQTFFQDSCLAGALVRPFCPIALVGSFRDLGFWRTWPARLKMRVSYPLYTGFIANSAAVKNFYVMEDGIDPGRVQVIYNGIDLPPEAEHADAPPTVGIVGNFNRPVKRMGDFVLAAARVRERFPAARFVMVGDGGLMPELIARARTLGLIEAFTFTGSLADPMEEIRRFAVGVMTSESEGFCNAILEYMAVGIPVVATDTGGNREQIVAGENGYLVPVGNVEALADRIVALLADPQRRRQMGARGRNRTGRDFCIRRMVAAHEDFYLRQVETVSGAHVKV